MTDNELIMKAIEKMIDGNINVGNQTMELIKVVKELLSELRSAELVMKVPRDCYTARKK